MHMGHISTNFVVDSSNRSPFRVQTDTQSQTQVISSVAANVGMKTSRQVRYEFAIMWHQNRPVTRI